ncbi:MAG: riboflavin biosynthesis protein RibF [Acidobacteriaceae bacterium]|nr:riboflavin biosynthesis protein RibF [Acidobacteriaceae bacterium]
MQIYRHLREVPAGFGPAIATIGNFDGVHRGHQWIISRVIDRARALGLQSVVVTFDPHPARVLHPHAGKLLITPLAQKLELLQATGVDVALVLPFTSEFSHMSARAFATDVLERALHIAELHEGEDFRFGHKAEAGIDRLESLSHELGFRVETYAPRIARGWPVSSTCLRRLITEGSMGQARALLGRPFQIVSTPAPGRGYGSRYTVPTINLAPYAELLPANGVYVTALRVGEENFDAVTNVGNRPTFGPDSFTVESHILNFHPIALTESTPIRLSFLHRLREEVRWPTPEALREQIGRDVKSATRYFSLCRRLGS